MLNLCAVKCLFDPGHYFFQWASQTLFRLTNAEVDSSDIFGVQWSFSTII